MKVENYKIPHSSFLSMEKDLNQITGSILRNKNLKKLLYYTTENALSMPDLTDDQSVSLFGRNIRIAPKLYIDQDIVNYIIISFDDFSPNAKNPEFRDCTICFDIICHFNQWQLTDFKLRPYRIAAELDTMFNKAKFSGIGRLEFIGGLQMLLDDEYGGLTLRYRAINGEDDKKNPVNPEDDDQMKLNFKDLQDSLKEIQQ